MYRELRGVEGQGERVAAGQAAQGLRHLHHRGRQQQARSVASWQLVTASPPLFRRRRQGQAAAEDGERGGGARAGEAAGRRQEAAARGRAGGRLHLLQQRHRLEGLSSPYYSRNIL